MSRQNWIGKTIGERYEITELLGQGGMSAVYKANDPNLRRVVAVKLIHSHLSDDPEFVRRFEEEAAAVASLRHPNIIQVFDFDHDVEDYYIVFEFIPGESLQAHLTRLNKADRKMPYSQIADLMANVAEALDYAHGQGMVHRDIKPANVMLNVMGQAILMDFGVVKIIGGDTHTATGAVLGTARYMSPEQIRGEKVDGRTDIYAMGVMLFEMVSGEPPFQADSALTLMMMHVNDPVPDLRQIRSDVPEDLVSVIERSMAKNPAKRFQTGAELAGALQAARLDVTAISGSMTTPAAAAAASQMLTMPEMDAPEIPVPQQPASQTQDVSRPDSLSQQPPVPPPAQTAGAVAQPPDTGAEKKNNNMLLFGGIGVVALLVGCLVVVAVLAASGVFSGDGGGEATSEAGIIETESAKTAESATSLATEEATEIAELPSDTPTSTATPSATSTPTLEPDSTATNVPPAATEIPPTVTTAPTIAPSPTTAAGPAVRIDNIGISGGSYVVNYTPIGYTPQLPGTHIHFFWNTVPPQNAGVGPTAESWILYGGPNPFTQYSVSDRPAGASQMCTLVANPDHTIQLNTGNCYNLPQ
jgi:serine/threonine-protein kinase